MSVGLVTIPANQLLPWEVNRNSTSPGLTSVYLLTFAVQLELTRGFMNNFFISQEDRSINADADTPDLIQDFNVLKASEWDIFLPHKAVMYCLWQQWKQVFRGNLGSK